MLVEYHSFQIVYFHVQDDVYSFEKAKINNYKLNKVNYRLQNNSLCRGTRLWHVGIEQRKRNLPDKSRNDRVVPVRCGGFFF